MPQKARLLASLLFLTPTLHTAKLDLIAQVRKTKKDHPLAEIVILAPSAGVIADLCGVLGNTIGVKLYQFYWLGNAILDEASIPIHEINDTAIRRLIRIILSELNCENKLSSFAPMRSKPGFSEVLLDWVREMKSQGIFPEQFAEYALLSGEDRDMQLAEFYSHYQGFLQRHNFSDADGLLWISAEALEKNPVLFQSDGALFVYGFDQFTPLQVRILEQLSRRFTALSIFLVWDENRPENSLALARLNQTRQTIIQRIQPQVHQLADDVPAPQTLEHLRKTLFETGEKYPINNDDTTIHLIEAPSREAEVRRTLLEIKRLLIEGVTLAEIAVLAPNLSVYLPIVRSVAEEYGIPIEYHVPLLNNPAVAALVKLLRLYPDFPWRDTFDILRSPYICQTWLSDEQIDLLDQLSRERPVVSGRDQWLFALQPLDAQEPDAEDEDLSSPPLVSRLLPQVLAAIEEGLNSFFDHLTPLIPATYQEFTWWIQTALIGLFLRGETPEDEIVEPGATLDLLGCCQKTLFSRRDLAAIDLVMDTLRLLYSAAELIPAEKVVTWETFRDDLISSLRVVQIPPDPSQNLARFSRLEEGRSREVDYLFILGLSEGEFPRSPEVDVLYSQNERERHPLPLIRFTQADDASLWWQALGNCRKRLTILRPYIDVNGAPWQTSPYWDAVLGRFINLEVEHIPIAEAPSLENAASANEYLIALAHSQADQIPDAIADQWSYIQNANQVMHQRQSYHPPGEYEGILQNYNLRRELASRFDASHIWSASRLNRYADCPFGFFAEHILELKARQEPQEGLDAIQRGSILHAVLEHFFRKLTGVSIRITISNLDKILDLLDKSCTAVFLASPQRYGIRPGVLWRYEQEELRRMVRVLVSWECEQNGENARYSPYLQEAGFGFSKNGPPPLDIKSGSIEYRLHGLIDRLDRDAAGNLRVLDYKSGSVAYSKADMEKGLALQTALYALAAEKFWLEEGAIVAESHYWHIPSREASGNLDFQGTVRESDLAESAISQAALNVERVRAGVFPSAPAKPGAGSMLCRGNCDYSSICRVTRQSIHKARQGNFS